MSHPEGPCAGLPECEHCRDEAESLTADLWEEEQRQRAVALAPERIWLQGVGNLEVTWCSDQINFDDVEYIRADLKAREQ